MGKTGAEGFDKCLLGGKPLGQRRGKTRLVAADRVQLPPFFRPETTGKKTPAETLIRLFDAPDVANVASQSDNHYTLPASSFRLFLKRPIFSKDFFTV